ncbi:MAG: CapA family protein [Acidimicrobiia bacterium]|nr:CapA family protein [Acidimicrobiia bacterium]
MRTAILLIAAALVAACSGSDGAAGTVTQTATGEPTARVLLVGDVMTGRGLADLLASSPDDVFSGVRHLLTGADLAAANLESPLTVLPHTSSNENQLQADPATAATLAAAGFDVLSLPNNHTMDSGTAGLLDTMKAAGEAGLLTVGAGADETAAYEPLVVTSNGIDIGFLAFDTTGVGAAAGTEPGLARWDEDRAVAAVADLRELVDVVVVSVHGGTEYLPVTDPGMEAIAATLTAAGTDIVWGHGAHVVQPVAESGDAIVSASLGNFLFDQAGTDRTTGYMLEAIIDTGGVVAYRIGITEHPDGRVEFVEWVEPVDDAVWLHGSWWSLLRPVAPVASTVTELGEFRFGDVVASAAGDMTGDGNVDAVVSFRRPHRTTPLMEAHPDVQWADASGRSAHLGVYEPGTFDEIWVAGTVFLPIAGLEACDGTLALVHDSLDDPTLLAGSAWEWNGFGFDTGADISGAGTPACADIDGDGRTEPVILGRG